MQSMYDMEMACVIVCRSIQLMAIALLCVCSEEMPDMVDPSFNISQYEYAFDMAADIEPIPPIDTSAIDYDNLGYDGGNDFDDLTQGMCNAF